MLDANLVADFERLLSVEKASLNEQTQRDLIKAVSLYNGRGVLHSTVAMKGAVDIAHLALPVYARAALNLIVRTATAHAVGIVPETQSEILDLLERHIRAELDELRAMVTHTPAFKGSLKKSGDQILSRLDTITEHELTRMRGEIGLIATANKKRAESASETGSSTVIVHGPVGVLQTGHGSIGISNQTIDGGAREALEKALTALMAELASERTNDVSFDREEVKELILEVQAEIGKEKPNRTRLKGIVSAIGGAISFTPKLQSFYETVKWAALLIGLTLP